MKILCVTYRNWAKDIYSEIQYRFKEHEFIFINSKEEYDENKEHINNINPNLILWYGWSWIIPESITNKYFSVMLHPSALPKYRGGSPIQNQIINGEKQSKVTLFKIGKGIDDGDIISQLSYSLEGDLDEIFDNIVYAGIILTTYMIMSFPDIKLTPQNSKKSTYFKRRTPKQSEITVEDFNNFTSEQLYNKIRALQNPYPNAFITCKDNTKLYINKSSYE